MPKFIKAIPGPKHTVVYFDEEGQQTQYSKGSRTWRNQNPGNLVPGSVSRRHNQIGKAAGFAIFPDYDTGHEALLDLLENIYGDFTIPKLVKKYAPPEDHNNIKNYERFLRKQTGVNDNKPIKDFTKLEFQKLWRAIEKMEGWEKGEITKLTKKKKITKVRKNKKGTIIAYYVKELGWVSKVEAVNLVQSGEVDGVIAISRAGNPFIKSRPDGKLENNLDSLG